MTIAAPELCSSYLLHGVQVDVITDDPAVAAAMDLRLCSFKDARSAAGPVLRLEFRQTSLAAPLAGVGQPVYETPHGTLNYFPDHDLLAGELGGIALHCELSKLRALVAAPDFRDRALYFATHPVTTVALMELMERLGRFSLHAACLADANGKGVVISGPSGAGKSTLTLALARTGMGFLGDDVLFLERATVGAPQVRALGFPDAIGLGSFAASRFPELAPLAAEPPAEGFPKRLHRFERLFGREPLASCEPRVVVFPEVAAETPSAVTPLDRGQALLRLVPDVLMTQRETTQSHIAAIAELLEQTQCYALRSGYDLEQAADQIRALL
jgi:hypothetical protein